MAPVILAPWRDAGCPWRARSKGVVEAHWAAAGHRVVIGEPDPVGPFRRSQAMNRAATVAGDWDVALLIDLDTITPVDQATEALHIAATTDRPVAAFTDLVLVGRPLTRRAHASGRQDRLSGTKVRGHVSCAVAVSRALWDTVGGFDERFVGWGAEDRAFWAACTTLAGPGERIDGPCYHLWHPRTAERHASSPTWRPNVELADRYRAAGAMFDGGYLARHPLPASVAPDVDAMRRLLTEPGGPLSGRVALRG